VCRQVMLEFCGEDFLIHMKDSSGQIVTRTLTQLLPLSFSGGEHLL
jgi:cytidine deaminase